MPKTLNRVTLGNNCVKFIEAYCKRKDISEAAFSRKFGKNNRWVSDLRRGKNTNLPSKELAVQMCLTLNVSPDDILLHEGKTPEETKKCLEDIETVRKLVEAESAKKPPIRRPRVRMRSLRNLLPGLAGCLRSRRARCLL